MINIKHYYINYNKKLNFLLIFITNHNLCNKKFKTDYFGGYIIIYIIENLFFRCNNIELKCTRHK